LNPDEGAEEALRLLINRHDDYEAAVEAERTARTTLEAERRQLRWCEGYEAWMEEATAADLEQEREAARADAAQEEAHLEEIKTIERDVEAAREGGTVEQLRAEYRRARTQLADDRDRDYDRAVGKVIADLVQEKTRDRGLPPVFHRARDLFADITNDRYELTLDRKTGTFRAYDHVYDDSFSLDGLERLFEATSGRDAEPLGSVTTTHLLSSAQSLWQPAPHARLDPSRPALILPVGPSRTPGLTRPRRRPTSPAGRLSHRFGSPERRHRTG